MSILGDIINIRGALQQQAQQRQLYPLALQQAQQQTQQGQMGLDYQQAMNAAILQALRGGQVPQSQGLMPASTTQSAGGPVNTYGLGNAPAPAGLLPQQQSAGGLFSPPQTQPPQQAPSWLAPPSLGDISSLPVGGLPASVAPLLAIKAGKSPAEAANEARQAQLATAKQKYDPIVQQLAAITQSDNPVRDINANPLLKATWAHYATARGLDPSKDLNQTNAYQVFGDLANQYRAQLGESSAAPPVPLQTITLPDGRTAQVNRITGQQTVQTASPVEKVIGPDGKPINVPLAQAAGKEPYSPFAVTQDQMQGPVGALDAALTQAGVNIPGGRGGQLYIQKLSNLIRANPGIPPQQIAEQVRTGQLDFNGQKRSTGQLSTVLANTNAFSLQLGKNLDSLASVQNAVDATGVPIVNRAFAAFKQNISGGKDIAKYTAYFNAAASEYAKIISGGTGVAAPNKEDMDEARRVMVQAYTSGGLDGLREALMTEAENKRASYQEGLNSAARTTVTSTAPVTQGVGSAIAAAVPPEVRALLKKYSGQKNGGR